MNKSARTHKKQRTFMKMNSLVIVKKKLSRANESKTQKFKGFSPFSPTELAIYFKMILCCAGYEFLESEDPEFDFFATLDQ